jgi:hypothetical protein
MAPAESAESSRDEDEDPDSLLASGPASCTSGRKGT